MGLFYVQEQGQDGKSLSWVRFVGGVALLVALVLGAVFTAGDPDLVKLHETLLKPIEVLLGTFVGLVAGEGLSS